MGYKIKINKVIVLNTIDIIKVNLTNKNIKN